MDYSDWTHWLALVSVVLTSLLGVALTAITLPGTWLIVLVAMVVAFVWPELMIWWQVVILAGLAVIGEIIEFAASAVGAARYGASKRGAVGAIVGSIIGAIAGAPLFFPIGSIAGGAIGAGVGAVLVERHGGRRTWKESARAGQGAAIGRVLATVGKTAVAAIIGIWATVVVIAR